MSIPRSIGCGQGWGSDATWDGAAGGIISDPGGSTSDFTVNWTAAGTFRLKRTFPSGCFTTVVYSSYYTIYAASVNGGSVGSNQTVCYNADVAPFANSAVASGGNGTYSYQWEMRAPGGTWTNIAGATGLAYDHGNVTSAWEFRRKVSSCITTAYSNTITVAITPNLVAGSVGSSQLICSNADVALFTSTVNAGGGNGSYAYQWQWRSPGQTWSNLPGATSATYDHGTLSSTKEFRREVISCGQTKYSNILTVTVDAQSNGGTLGPHAEKYGVANGLLSLTGQTGAIQKWWKKEGSGSWQEEAGTANTLSYSNITITTAYHAEVKNGVCPAVTSNDAVITIHPEPSISIQGETAIVPGGSTNIITDAGLYSYQWFKNGAPIVSETSRNLLVRNPGTYKVSVKATSTAPVYTTGDVIISALSENGEGNYILRTNFQTDGITSQTDLFDLQPADLDQVIQYFDGLGRPSQTINIGNSPDGHDVVRLIQYDRFGREEYKYLPYARETLSGTYVDNALTAQAGFYQTAPNVAHDGYPFQRIVFEPSPLQPVVKLGAPGESWQPDADSYLTTADHSVKHSYELNVGSDVLLWTYTVPTTAYLFGSVNASTGSTLNYHNANELFKTRTKDEEQHEVIEYKNKLGQVILKSVQGPAGTWGNTYYVYDDFGNLVVVIPPEATGRLTTAYFNQTDPVVKDTFLKRWAFRYRYDQRRRMIIKQVPGADPVYLIYDRRDRLVMTQDGNQRNLATKEWTFTKYDALNRPVLTGIYKDTQNRDQQSMQTAVNAFYDSANPENWYEEKGIAAHGYTNRSYPGASAENEFLTVTYYDNYDFLDDHPDSSFYYTRKDLPNLPATPFERVRGYVTGTKIKVLGTPDFLTSVFYYDDRYRTIQIKRQNYKDGIDRVSTVYDFVGKIVETKATHTSNQVPLLVSRERNEYDHAGRLIKQFHTAGNNSNNVIWIDRVGVSANADELSKTAASGNFDAGARTRNSISAQEDGWFEVTVAGNYRVNIGLNNDNLDAGYTTMDYALYLAPDWGLTVYEGGVSRGAVGTYAVGDVIRLERLDGEILYKKNGVVIHESQVASTTALFGDVSLYNTGDKITSPRMSVGPEYLITTNVYNELGQLIDKNLGGAADNYNQSTDYRYNIRGWLTSINNAQLTNDASTNNEVNDLFGMELLYDSVDASLGNTAQYNGNISAVKWKSPVAETTPLEDRKSYSFTYDPMNRLEQAAFAAFKLSGSWTAEVGAFDERLGYDLNGNIQTLKRNSTEAGTTAFTVASAPIDDLAYTYLNGNQLSRVEDVIPGEAGFNNGATGDIEYLYDANGNMKNDLNKGIDSIVYNHLNLPALITFSNGGTIQYTYDATGAKLKQTTTEGGTAKVTDYVGNIVYERDTLQFFSIPEGRVVNDNGNHEYQFMIRDHLGNTRVLYGKPFEGSNVIANNDCNRLDYLGAHQNVTRSLETIEGETYIKFVSNQNTNTPGMVGSYFIDVKAGDKYTFKVKGYRATTDPAFLYVWANTGEIVWPGTNLPYGAQAEGWVSNDFTVPQGATKMILGVLWRELAGLNTGATFFLNEVALYKHQDDDYPAGFEVSQQENEYNRFSNYDPTRINNSGAYARTGSSAYLLNGSTQVSNMVIGPAKSLRVYPGDMVRMEVYAKYLTGTAGGTDVGGVIAGALQAAFGLSAGGVTDVAYQSIGNLFGDGSIIGTAAYPYDEASPPKAFLNYILFDDDYVPYDFGYDQVGSSGALPGSTGAKMSLVAKVRKPGYIYIYLSNENPVVQEVFFDDLSIRHVKGVAIQGNDYYSFGLAFNSYHRENSLDQKYLYNGKELQDELNLGWFDYGARMYQPDLGRFFTQDRFAEKYLGLAPYQYTANNPILFVDINGDSIRIAKGKHELTYRINKDGSSSIVDKNGNAYQGKRNKQGEYRGFVGKTQRALDEVRNGGDSGKGLVTAVHDHKRDVTIQRGANGFEANGMQLTISWSPGDKSGGLDINGSSRRPAFIGLGHELAHGYDALDGHVAPGDWYTNAAGQGISNAEKFAVHVENTLRSENSIPLREFYGAKGEGLALVGPVNSANYSVQASRPLPPIGSYQVRTQHTFQVPFIYGTHKLKY